MSNQDDFKFNYGAEIKALKTVFDLNQILCADKQ